MGTTTAYEPTIDLEVFEGLRDEFGNELLVGLVGTFCDRAPLVNDVVRASRGADRIALVRHAHRLRSTATSLGVTRLAELCRDLERLAGTASPEEWEPGAGAVAAEYVRAVAALSDALAARRPGRRARRSGPRTPAAGSA